MRSIIKLITSASLIFVNLSIIGCDINNSQLPINPSNAPLRDDGVLDFLKPDGSIITSISIEIAETSENIKRGLMWRYSLDTKRGMLFVFQDLGYQTFWMRNTPVPLDIIFIGENSCVKNIAESTRPMSDESYHSKGPAQYVLEVRAGFSERYGIKAGHCIRWQRHKEQQLNQLLKRGSS